MLIIILPSQKTKSSINNSSKKKRINKTSIKGERKYILLDVTHVGIVEVDKNANFSQN